MECSQKVRRETKYKDNLVSTADFLVQKIERSKTELSQSMSVSERVEIAKHQDRLVDLLCEESERIRQTKDIDKMEYLMSCWEFLRRDLPVEE